MRRFRRKKTRSLLDKTGPAQVYYNVRREVPLSKNKYSAPPDSARLLADAYDSHGAALFRYAAVLCASRSFAEDAVQQAFTKLAALGSRIAEIESLPHYLRTAVRNESFRLLQTPRLTPLHDDAPFLEPVDAALQNEEERRAVQSALAGLPAEQREIVHLKVYESQTFQEIAALLGIPANTAASRYRYAIEKLRERLAILQKDEA